MGVLSELLHVQETYRGILNQLRRQPDKSFEQALTEANSEAIDDEALIALAVSLHEIGTRTEEARTPRENDLLWGIDILDQLDTQGFEVIRKQ